MELLKIILDFIAKIAWPITIIGVLIFFKKYIIELFPYITKLKAGGIEVSVEQKIASIVEETLENKNVQTDIPDNLKQIVYQEDEPIKNIEKHEKHNAVMLAFAAGESINLNLKYDIYYDPADRNHNTPFSYVGLYNQLAIVAVGKLSKIVYCDYKNGELVATHGDNLDKLSSNEYNRIKDVIKETDYYDISQGCKFFIIDKFCKTNYRKSSPYPLRAKKYFWLNQIKGFNINTSILELSEELNKLTWE